MFFKIGFIAEIMRWSMIDRPITRRSKLLSIILFSVFFYFFLWPSEANYEKRSMPKGVCRIPKLEVNDSTLNKFYYKPAPHNCNPEKNWAYVENGRFCISSEATRVHGPITCNHVRYLRLSDDQEVGEFVVKNVKNGSLVEQSDFFRADCYVTEENSLIKKRLRSPSWSNHFATVVPDASVLKRVREAEKLPSWSGLNVHFLGFDTVSHMTFQRKLKNTYKYLINDLEAVVLKGYNIVGDRTPAAYFPILSGRSEEELPLLHKGEPSSESLNAIPWIWNKFSKHGYVTNFGEDSAYFGMFTWRFNGFGEQPTDHYTRTFFLKTEAEVKDEQFCIGSEPQYKVWFRYAEDLFDNYPRDVAKFSVMHHGKLSHDDMNLVELVDDELEEHLRNMERKGHLNNSLLIIMSDHGARFDKTRETHQGHFEERLPFFSFVVPRHFRESERGKKAWANLLANANRLTSPFDIYSTLMDILSWPTDEQLSTPGGHYLPRSISLWRPVPEERSCQDAAISSHWCACLQSESAVGYEHEMQIAARAVVNFTDATLDYNGFVVRRIRLSASDAQVFNGVAVESLETSDSIPLHDGEKSSINSGANRLLCWIIMSSESDIFNVTWTEDCEETVLLMEKNTSVSNFLYNTVFIDIPLQNRNDSLWIKTRVSISEIYKDYMKNFDWFVIVNDDTDVTTSVLRKFLIEFDASEPQYFGYTWAGLMKTGHRGGFVLSRKAISWLEMFGLPNTTMCSDSDIGSERIRNCMQKLGVFSGIDPRFHKAFVPRKTVLSSKIKLILTWNTLLKQDIPTLASEHSKFCPVKCELSSDKILFDVADAIVYFIHPLDGESLKTLPATRFPWQRYVFFNIEPYSTEPHPVEGIAMPLFNWSMTYLRDSDIRLDYYGQILKTTQSSSQRNFIRYTAKNKSRMVAWLVSNCDANSKRQDYVKELGNYVTIDQFGKCGNTANITYNCSRDSSHYGYWCNEIPFTTDYRFYIAFENAACRDYVSEKFYQTIDRFMVPIIMRKSEFIDIAPEGSYIAADQFSSPKHLAEYLHYLVKNPEKYLKYFEFRKRNTVVWKENEMIEDAICRLCRMLHENRKVAIASDMQGSWKKDTACVKGFAKLLGVPKTVR